VTAGIEEPEIATRRADLFGYRFGAQPHHRRTAAPTLMTGRCSVAMPQLGLECDMLKGFTSSQIHAGILK